MRILISLAAVLAVVFSAVYISRASRPRKDPLIPKKTDAGVVYNDRRGALANHYFVVQNWAYSEECSVYAADGRFVHRFPGQFCIFPEDGGLITEAGDFLIAYDGNLYEKWRLAMDVHHDIFLDNGRREVAVLHRDQEPRRGFVDDRVTVVSLDGEVVFDWRVRDRQDEIARAFATKLEYEYDELTRLAHVVKLNSVQIIPPNARAASDPAFQAGNILLNDRLHSMIFILNREGRIVWVRRMSDQSRRSGHSPRVLANGNILYFQNRVSWTPNKNELDDLRRRNALVRDEKGDLRYSEDFCAFEKATLFYSKIVEFDPASGRIAWEYVPEDKLSFCSYYYGYVETLANGHLLVSHISNGGAAFELTREGEIVWEWVREDFDENGRRKLNYLVRKVPKRLVDRLLSAQIL